MYLVKDKHEFKKHLLLDLTASAQTNQISVSQPVIAYLAEMLAGYLHTNALFRSYEFGDLKREKMLTPLSLFDRTARTDTPKLKRIKAQMIGDECLFLLSLFYERIARDGQGQVNLHRNLGRGAYDYLSTDNSSIFWELARDFDYISQVVIDIEQAKRIESILKKRIEMAAHSLIYS